MTPKDLAAMRAREIKEEEEEAKCAVVTLRRHELVQALNTAADTMQTCSIVAKSDAWKGHYMKQKDDYRNAANMIALGAGFAIKE